MARQSQRVLEAQRREAEFQRKKALVRFECDEDRLRNFFEPDEEGRDVDDFIRDYLLTEQQRYELFKRKCTVNEIMNGRVEQRDGDGYDEFEAGLFADWNEKLGQKCFGF
jgi:hypothetical protein